MNRTPQLKKVITFISDNPDCLISDVVAGTGIHRTVVSGILSRMTRERVLIRTGMKTKFRYRAAVPEPSIKTEAPPEPVNLNKLFNSLLRNARENRA
ncbi:hypothetical protein [Pseudescherichia vulneris]|uniref:hypothetical protein n=1 Tax=Pseudescherichia vulneris TaxID=566 RepID=UPI0028D26482|nr:hypothetical protein [Pseudescherichia vulneris]